jgi:hypothetical protein
MIGIFTHFLPKPEKHANSITFFSFSVVSILFSTFLKNYKYKTADRGIIVTISTKEHKLELKLMSEYMARMSLIIYYKFYQINMEKATINTKASLPKPNSSGETGDDNAERANSGVMILQMN